MIAEHTAHISCSICKEKVQTLKVPAEGISFSSLKEIHACPTCGHTGGLKLHIEKPEEEHTQIAGLHQEEHHTEEKREEHGPRTNNKH